MAHRLSRLADWSRTHDGIGATVVEDGMAGDYVRVSIPYAHFHDDGTVTHDSAIEHVRDYQEARAALGY